MWVLARRLAAAAAPQCRQRSSRARNYPTANRTPATAKWVMPKFKEFKKRNDKMIGRNQLPENFGRRSTFIEWNVDAEFSAFQARVGLPLDRGLWDLALTDRSFVLHQEQTAAALGLEDTAPDAAPAPPRASNCELAEEGRALLREVAEGWLAPARPSLPREALKSYVDELDSDAVMADFAASMGLRALLLQEEGAQPTAEALARAARAVVAVARRSAGQRRAADLVVQRLVPFVLHKDVFDVYDLEEPLLAVERALAADGRAVEPRLVAEAGRNTLEAVFCVALYDCRRSMLAMGYGETVDTAVDEAARECLRRLWGATPCSPPLPFPPSLPPPYASLPYAPSASNAPKNVPMDKFSLENADPRFDNIVVC